MLIFKAIIGAFFWMATQVYRECISAFISLRASWSGRYSDHTARFKGGLSRVFRWEGLTLGENVQIMDGCVIDANGEVWIGKDTIISRNVTILSSQHVKDPAPFHPTDRSYGNVVIGERVWIGQGAIVMPNTHIGDEAIIGAGAIVSGVVEAGAIYVSPKATKIKSRYEK